MDDKCVQEILNTFSHEGNANKVTGRMGELAQWLS